MDYYNCKNLLQSYANWLALQNKTAILFSFHRRRGGGCTHGGGPSFRGFRPFFLATHTFSLLGY